MEDIPDFILYIFLTIITIILFLFILKYKYHWVFKLNISKKEEFDKDIDINKNNDNEKKKIIDNVIKDVENKINLIDNNEFINNNEKNNINDNNNIDKENKKDEIDNNKENKKDEKKESDNKKDEKKESDNKKTIDEIVEEKLEEKIKRLKENNELIETNNNIGIIKRKYNKYNVMLNEPVGRLKQSKLMIDQLVNNNLDRYYAYVKPIQIEEKSHPFNENIFCIKCDSKDQEYSSYFYTDPLEYENDKLDEKTDESIKAYNV